MSKRFCGLLRTALIAGGVLTLTTACDGEPKPSKVVTHRPLPSVAKSPTYASVGSAPGPHLEGVPRGERGGPITPVVVMEPPPVTAPARVEPPKPVGPHLEGVPRGVRGALGFDGHLAEGVKWFEAGDQRAALEHFEQAAVIKPKNATARIQLARTLLALGEKQDARTYVEQALDLAPTSAPAWNTLGRIELAEGDVDAAISSFRRASDEDPKNAHAWNNLGYALMTLGQYEEAAVVLESATAGSDSPSYMWNNLGMAYEHVDRIREARAAYRQAGSLGSTKGDASASRLEGVRTLRDEDATARVEPDSADEDEPSVAP